MNAMIRLALLAVAALALAGCTPSPSPSGSPSDGATTAVPTTPPTGATTSAPPTSPAGETTIAVFFDNTVMNPNAENCSAVFVVERTVPATDDEATAALGALLAGPTPEEEADGYSSWFSEATADALLGVKVEGDTAYVNLADLRQVIPNAGTSCGSGQFMASLNATTTNATGASKVLYAFEGDPVAFWDFVQVGCGTFNDDCDPAPFADLGP
ncbi:MAG: GerMN domain-containing protein [Actinomycetes bacterium]|nr:GerMN domain-containing protein [Actinomycetes bacterium]MDX5380298.1 GerMN domain-containing protein [Actinomycetes bacterium]MDX5399037.1 GerMN domain-containing protein [Actinomycetes bacterium]MDX5450029.1 GerMN domain-containing protein [Actinomycetes bacterium]